MFILKPVNNYVKYHDFKTIFASLKVKIPMKYLEKYFYLKKFDKSIKKKLTKLIFINTNLLCYTFVRLCHTNMHVGVTSF